MHLLRGRRHSTNALGFLLLAACSDRTAPSPSDARLALAVGAQHACHSNETGTRCWGAGTNGQLGIGVTPAETTVAVVGGVPQLVALTAGSAHTCGLDSEGNAYCWGSNRDGQLGTLEGLEQCPLPCATTPRLVAGGLHFTAIAAGTRHTCGITTDRAAYCWGLNDVGQLGTREAVERCEDGACSRVPMPVRSNQAFAAVTAAIYHSCALKIDGTAFCWGFQVGTTKKVHTLPEFTPEVTEMPGNLGFHQISAGGMHTCGVTGAGAAYCWGIDAIGAGPTVLESDVPVAVAGGHRFRSVYSGGRTSCGIDGDGAAFCWGPNTEGEIGTEPVGSTIRFDLPSPVSGGLGFTALAPGHSTYCGITTSETVVCWGRGTSGELGTGHEDRTTPVPVPGL